MRRFNLEGLRQSENCFMTDKDPQGQNISRLFVLCFVNAQQRTCSVQYCSLSLYHITFQCAWWLGPLSVYRAVSIPFTDLFPPPGQGVCACQADDWDQDIHPLH